MSDVSKETHTGRAVAAVIGAILIGFALAACGLSGSAVPPPAYVMDAAGQWQMMGQSSYCWSAPSGRYTEVVCADNAWPPPQGPTVPVSGGQPLRFQFKQTPAVLDVTLYDAAQPSGNPVLYTSLTPADREVSWLPDVPAGSYLVTVFGRWGSDDSTYYAWIEIGESAGDAPIPFQPQSETVRPVYLLVGDERVRGEAASRVGADGSLVFVPPVGAPISVAVGEGVIAATDPPQPTRVIFLIETGDGTETVLDSDEVAVEDGRAMWTPDVLPGSYILVVTVEWPDSVSVVAFNLEVG